MLEKKLNENMIFLRVDKDEEIISKIKEISQKYRVNSGRVTGIGALKRAILGYYTGEKYAKTEVNENMELISCLGDISSEEGYTIHLHSVLGNRYGDTKAGHLFEGVISCTGEFFIEIFPEKLERKHDPTTKLNVIE